MDVTTGGGVVTPTGGVLSDVGQGSLCSGAPCAAGVKAYTSAAAGTQLHRLIQSQGRISSRNFPPLRRLKSSTAPPSVEILNRSAVARADARRLGAAVNRVAQPSPAPSARALRLSPARGPHTLQVATHPGTRMAPLPNAGAARLLSRSRCCRGPITGLPCHGPARVADLSRTGYGPVTVSSRTMPPCRRRPNRSAQPRHPATCTPGPQRRGGEER
jgi:hypothetical protein